MSCLCQWARQNFPAPLRENKLCLTGKKNLSDRQINRIKGLTFISFSVNSQNILPDVGGTPLDVAVVIAGVGVVAPGGRALEGDNAHCPVVMERSSSAMSPLEPDPTIPSKII